MPKNEKYHVIFRTENVENHAIFVEGFWPDFYARGRFMKYSMSAFVGQVFFTIDHLIWVIYGITSTLPFGNSNYVTKGQTNDYRVLQLEKTVR